MLEELYKKGYLNYSQLILDHSKVLGLNAEETFVLNKILTNYLKTETLSLEELQQQVLMPSNKVDKILSTLMERGYYEVYLAYDHGKGTECVSFKPLFKQLEKVIQGDFNFDAYDLSQANSYLETKLNRVLTASELEILQGLMVDDHFTLDQIKEATEEIISNKKVLSMRTLTAGLNKPKKETSVSKTAPKVFKDFLSGL